MPYSVRMMHEEDIAQVNRIDREAFPTQLPPPNYQHELRNRLAHYIVVCDESKAKETPEIKTAPEKASSGTLFRLKRWFHHDRSHRGKIPPPSRDYIAGFAGIWVMADEAHITNIAVRTGYQRQGLGGLLLIAIIELAEKLKANFITLEVRASNIAAQTLYRKYGFTQIGVRRGYYIDNREDGILMSTASITSAKFREKLSQLKQAHSANR